MANISLDRLGNREDKRTAQMRSYEANEMPQQ